jgi:hypothetical protein
MIFRDPNVDRLDFTIFETVDVGFVGTLKLRGEDSLIVLDVLCRGPNKP